MPYQILSRAVDYLESEQVGVTGNTSWATNCNIVHKWSTLSFFVFSFIHLRLTTWVTSEVNFFTTCGGQEWELQTCTWCGQTINMRFSIDWLYCMRLIIGQSCTWNIQYSSVFQLDNFASKLEIIYWKWVKCEMKRVGGPHLTQSLTDAPRISICLEIPSNWFSQFDRASMNAITPAEKWREGDMFLSIVTTLRHLMPSQLIWKYSVANSSNFQLAMAQINRPQINCAMILHGD